MLNVNEKWCISTSTNSSINDEKCSLNTDSVPWNNIEHFEMLAHYFERFCFEGHCSDWMFVFHEKNFSSVLLFSSCPPVQLLKSTDLGRHSLLYLKEIGNGWFGKVSPLLTVFRTGISESVLWSQLPAETGLVSHVFDVGVSLKSSTQPFRTDFTLVKMSKWKLCTAGWTMLCLQNQITRCCPSLSFSPPPSLSISPPHFIHEFSSVLYILVYLDWVCPSVLVFIFSSLDSCMTCMLYVSVCLVPLTSCWMGLFGRKCPSVCICLL